MVADRSLVASIAGFAVVATVFLASTVVLEARSTAIDATVDATQSNSLPSIEAIAVARAALHHIDAEAAAYARDLDGENSASGRSIEESREELRREISAGMATPDYPGEAELRAPIARALDDVDVALARLIGAPPGDLARASRDVHDAVGRADDVIERLFAINLGHARDEVTAVGEVRRHATRLAIALDVACVAVSLAAAVLVIQAQRRRREAEEAHAQLLAERARDLDMFAKRVAHDLLSPLSALAFTLSSMKRKIAREEPFDDLIARADVCLRRSQRLVDGALDFARSGATTQRGTSAGVREAIDGVLDEARADEGHGVELIVEPFEDVSVECSPGVLASVVANLVRNAIKFMDEREVRRVTVRVRRIDDVARIEVADTGPGLPPGLEVSVFEPYVRAPDSAQPGLGLGLATVRRFVESHGGRVGVSSALGRGATFWFELPVARALRGAGRAS